MGGSSPTLNFLQDHQTMRFSNFTTKPTQERRKRNTMVHKETQLPYK